MLASHSAPQVSSTSWTADEDFSILLRACETYDAAARAAAEADAPPAQHLPRLLVLVTGSGPLRASYEARAAAMRMRHVAIRTAWLSAEDYALLLAVADLGVSLHASSSGLDLPMKVRVACVMHRGRACDAALPP